MFLSEQYKQRIKYLAGIISEEAFSSRKNDPFALSNTREPFNKDMIIKAIEEGREMGILYKSDLMPVPKYRIVYPVAIGMSKKGNLIIRAFHKHGQSESEARRTGVRSAEVQNAWRLLKATNIKGVWLTGNLFRGPLEAYNPNDKSMVSVEIAANFNDIINYQNAILKDIENNKKKLVQIPAQPQAQEPMPTLKNEDNLNKEYIIRHPFKQSKYKWHS